MLRNGVMRHKLARALHSRAGIPRSARWRSENSGTAAFNATILRGSLQTL